MTRITTAAALALTLTLPVAAQTTPEEMQLPPLSYGAPTFLHPNGCLYARADAPGAPRRWHAISNGNVIVAGAQRGTACTAILTQPAGASR